MWVYLASFRYKLDVVYKAAADKSETIRRIINQEWLSLQAGKQTVAERMGREPHLFDGTPDLSERKARERYIGFCCKKW